MEFWKSVMSQVFPFKRESSKSFAETVTPKKVEEPQSPKAMRGNENEEPLLRDPSKKPELERAFLDQMSQLLMKEGAEHTKVLQTIFQTRSNRAGEKPSSYVAQEVLKREILIALENIQRPRNDTHDEDARLIEKQSMTIDYLKRQLQKTSGRASVAEENINLLLKENHALRCACRKHEERNSELSKQLDNLSAEQEILGDRVKAWTTLSQQWEARAVAQQEAKIAAKARVLRAEQKVELAELRARHAASQSKMLEKRLEEAKSSSTTVFQRVEELRKLQAGILRSLANHSQRPVGYMSEGPSQLLGRGSKFLRRLWASIPLTTSRGTAPTEENNGKAGNSREAAKGESPTGVVNGDVDASTTTLFRLAGFRGFSTKAPVEQNNQATSSTHPQDPAARTLEALEKNLEALREIIQVKQEEVDRLHRELRSATWQANAFERCLGEERHKLQEMEHIKVPNRSRSCNLASPVDRNGAYGVYVEHSMVMHQLQRGKPSLREDRPCK